MVIKTLADVTTPVASEAVTSTEAAPAPLASLRPAMCLGSAAAALWVISLLNVRLDGMTDIGLVSVLPVTFYAALGCLLVSFCLLARAPRGREVVLGAHLVGMILMLHGTPAILYGTLRYAWAWKHVGIIDYIQRHGSVNPNIDYLSVYHNWPGFFGASALLTQIAGFKSALSFASWGPVFFNLTFVAGIVLIADTLTTDRRVVWMTAWLFVLTNWIGQDYFSPQAMNYFLYLCIIGICLRWLRTDRTAADGSGRRALGVPRSGLFGLILLLMVADASSHQLTPLMLIAGLGALAVFRQIRPRALPFVMVVVTGAWLVTGAAVYMHGNVQSIISSFGQLESNTNSNLINLANASKGQILVATFDRVLTALILVAAVAGCLLRRVRRGRWDLAAMLLAASPLPLLAANDYGGEMLFRVYFFALPFAAFFAACLIYPRTESRSHWVRTSTAILLSASLLIPMLFAYYGKERMYHFTHDEVAASTYVYGIAPAGSEIVSITANHPWPSRNYEKYTYLWLGLEDAQYRRKLLANPASVLTDVLTDPRHPAAYLVITDSQVAEVNMTGLMPAGSITRLEDALASSPNFTKVYAGPHASVWAASAAARRNQ